MAVRLIPCRHKTTGNTADLPETALKQGLFPRWIPIDAEKAESSGPAVEPPAPATTRKRKAAADGQDNNEE